MPHVELKYSDDINIDAGSLFDEIEKIINNLDSSAGVCKSRAYPASQYKHTHVLVSLALLTKSHRDDEFSKTLTLQVLEATKRHLNQQCYVSLELQYMNDYYITTTV